HFQGHQELATDIAGEVDRAHAASTNRRQHLKRTKYKSQSHAAQELAGLETRQLSMIDEIVRHGLGVVALVQRHVAQRFAELGAGQYATPQNGLEKAVDRGGPNALGHPWLLHTSHSLWLQRGTIAWGPVPILALLRSTCKSPPATSCIMIA